MAYAQAKARQSLAIGNGEARAAAFPRSFGNGGIHTSNSVLQAKLKVGDSGSPAEREADQVAARITGGPSRLHEQDGAMESGLSQESGLIQRSMKEGDSQEGSFEADAQLADQMGDSVSHHLDKEAGEEIGNRLGADFSGVQVHTDRHAQQIASRMSARAFTRGKDIYFNKGQYNPGTAAGKELLAHELTHTIQQGSISQKGGIPVSQSAEQGTAQRGFFSLRKHFRKAVDERNEFYDDYKKQSGWTRFKWAVKNPLAFALGRIDFRENFRKAVDERNKLYDDYKKQSGWTRFKWAVKNPLAFALEQMNWFGFQASSEERIRRREALKNYNMDTGKIDEKSSEPEAENKPQEGFGLTDAELQEFREFEDVDWLFDEEETSASDAAQEEGKVPEEEPVMYGPQSFDEFSSDRMREQSEDLELSLEDLDETQAEKRNAASKKIGYAKLGTFIPGMAAGTGGATVAQMLADWNTDTDKVTGMGKTLTKVKDTISGWGDYGKEKGEQLEKINTAISKEMSSSAAVQKAKIAEGSLDVIGGALGITSSALEMANHIRQGEDEEEGGDRQAALASRLDAAGDGAKILKSAAAIAKGGLTLAGKTGAAETLGKYMPGVGLLTGGAKVASGSVEIDRTRKVKNATENARRNYEERLQNDDLTAEEKKRLEAQTGFMRMGHNTARVDQTRAGYKVASGIMEMGGAAAKVSGVGSGIGTALSLGSTAVDIIGGLHANSKGKKLRKDEINKTFDLKAQIQMILDRDKQLPPEQRLNLTKNEAKHLVLNSRNLTSRTEAYMAIARDRKRMLSELSKKERAKMVRALGLDPKTASDAMIYQRLGVNKEDAANIDRAILKQRKKKTMPSWRQ